MDRSTITCPIGETRPLLARRGCKTEQNAVKSMILTDTEGRVLFCGPVQPGSCAGSTQARQPGPAQLLAHGPAMHEVAAGADGPEVGERGRVIT
ncbi:hypothetical protein ACF07B_20635 [Streptomyces sp. NPDC015532]|uniref:hypothetical protein n=1 Tax=Streptomyces sp. NPDC015532 TaxID=3364960 RepID=UPI0036FB4D64